MQRGVFVAASVHATAGVLVTVATVGCGTLAERNEAACRKWVNEVSVCVELMPHPGWSTDDICHVLAEYATCDMTAGFDCLAETAPCDEIFSIPMDPEAIDCPGMECFSMPVAAPTLGSR